MYRNRELTTGFIDECAAGFEWIVLWPRGNDGRWLVESRHREGALGRLVWVLLRYVPDWRWLLDRDDSPWYPSARLFRQPVAGDWALWEKSSKN